MNKINSKQFWGIVAYFVTAVLVYISDKITPAFKWSDLLQPHVLLPALVSGLVTVTAYRSRAFHDNADQTTEGSDPDLQ